MNTIQTQMYNALVAANAKLSEQMDEAQSLEHALDCGGAETCVLCQVREAINAAADADQLEQFKAAAQKTFEMNFSRAKPALFDICWDLYESQIGDTIAQPSDQDSVDRWMSDIGTQIINGGKKLFLKF